MTYRMQDWLATSSLGAASEEFLQQFPLDEQKILSIQQTEGICPLRLEKWINHYRQYGHFYAQINPLENPPSAESLEPENFGIPKDWLQSSQKMEGVFGEALPLNQLEQRLKATYCQYLGVEFGHIADSQVRQWLINEVEKEQSFTTEEQKTFYSQLVEAEGLERYLGAKFPGAKRFSLEGSDSFMVLMHEIIRYGKARGINDIVFGMAHRGRLNMLVNIFGKPPFELFDEFKGIRHPQGLLEKMGQQTLTGDVKYHQGRQAYYQAPWGQVELSLAFNPSHLEIVSPVVQGIARAKQDQKNPSKVLAVTVHGDSAVTGQGIVQESLNMSNTRGFGVGGTIRVVINNQVGFTTSNPQDTRSTHYCTAIAKMIDAPILHVNGDDPEAVARAARLAVNYRQQFKKDIFIELVAYRRLGHNEADEPSLTQPLMYQQIKQHPTVVTLYGEKLRQQKVMTEEEQKALQKAYRDRLENNQLPTTYFQHYGDSQIFDSIKREPLSLEKLKAVGEKIISKPKDFSIHSRVEKVLNDRKEMLAGEKPLDWGMAESLAYGTLLEEGVSIRLTGEDAGRATFSHRHAVFHHQQKNAQFIPLKQCENQSRFEVWDSVLTERGVLAFEYGYSLTKPEDLTIWEAQFGDFANVAQDVIDQFISSGEQKWGVKSGLTMLLPHGYEGQGPEHSSARLERYLQLCAQSNLRVCVPTTPAQIFHLLRQQTADLTNRRPLIVMSPKSLLRHPQAVSTLEDLMHYSGFKPVLVDEAKKEEVKRILFCTGKIYYDLNEAQQKHNKTDTLIVRLEQLYPFPKEEIRQILREYNEVFHLYWVQEEPENQGAWRFVFPQIKQLGGLYQCFPEYIGRPPMAATAEGDGSHARRQQEIVRRALGVEG